MTFQIKDSITVNETLVINSSGNLVTPVSTLTNGSYSLVVNSDGTITQPNGMLNAGTSQALLWSTNTSGSGLTYRAASGGAGLPFQGNAATNSSGFVITQISGIVSNLTAKSWTFDWSGNLTFPDATSQTTAYTSTAAKGLFSASNASASGSGGSLSYNNGVFTFTPALNITGNAATTTKLATARTINGTSFDGSANITLASLINGIHGISLNASGTTILDVGGLQFDDTTTQTTAYTGNAATATKLATARNINGVAFDGTAAITVTAAAGTLTGATLASGVTASSLTSVGTLSSLTSGGTVTINNAGAIAHGTGQLYINGSTYSRIDFSNVYAAPVVNDRSTGTRLLFNPSTAQGRLDCGIGMGSTTLWNSIQDSTFDFKWYAGPGGFLTSPVTLLTLSGSGLLTVPGAASVTNGSATSNGINIGTHGSIHDDGNFHIHATSSNLWLNAMDGSDINIGTQVNAGVTSNSNVSVGKNLTAGSGSITAYNGFVAGAGAISAVALQMPNEAALRNTNNGYTNMYFDVSIGGTATGGFQFRSGSGYNNFMTLDSNGPKSFTPYQGKTSFNVALDTVVTVDNLKYRISNQGGVFPQIASASGSQVDICYGGLGIINGSSIPASAQNSGYLLAAAGTWLSVFSSHGMDARGDYLVFHITDKNASKIYRVTYMKTNNSNNVDGYNIIVERII